MTDEANQQHGDRVAINADVGKLDPDFQRYISDPNPLMLDFLCAVSGWMVVTREEEVNVFGPVQLYVAPIIVLELKFKG